MFNGKFIATKSYRSGEWFTVGKIYEFIDGEITVDCGYVAGKYEDFKAFMKGNEGWTGYLIPLIKPPFTKQSLKDGFKVVYRGGVQGLVLTKTQTLHSVKNGVVQTQLSGYTDTFVHMSGDIYYDIMKVWDTEDNLVWERPKSPEQIEIERLELEIKNMTEKLAVLKNRATRDNKYEVGVKLKVINGGYSACSANGRVGIVTLDKSNSGLLSMDKGFNLKMENSGEVFRVSFDGEYEVQN